MVLMDNDDEIYTRNTIGAIYSRFEVPFGASYACGNNLHNIFKSTSNQTNGIQFTGIQVHITMQKYIHVHVHVHCFAACVIS